MTVIDTGLLVLTGLTAVMWWRVWHLVWRLPRSPRVAPASQGAQDQPLHVDIARHVAPPCVLCGDARHTAQEHVRLSQWELAAREATSHP